MGLSDRDYANSERSFRARTVSSVWPTPLVWGVLVAIVGTWAVQQFNWRFGLALLLSFEDGLAVREPWRWATFPLVHFAPIHAFMAALAVYLFLPQLEREWGWVRALGCFVAGNLFAAGVYALFVAGGARSPAFFGSAGGALAVLAAAAYRLPHENVFDAVPNRLMAALVGAMWVLFILGTRQVPNLAHLAGIPLGVGMGMWSGLRLGRRRRAAIAREPVRYPASHAAGALSLDEVLAKVGREGMGSLTADERRTLEIATERRRRKE